MEQEDCSKAIKLLIEALPYLESMQRDYESGYDSHDSDMFCDYGTYENIEKIDGLRSRMEGAISIHDLTSRGKNEKNN